jgi:hypothetical protein
MIADVRHHLKAGPFEPFVIVTSSGHRYSVDTADHAGVHPHGSRVVIWLDDDSSVTVAGLHIAAIEKTAPRKNGTVLFQICSATNWLIIDFVWSQES